MGGVVKISEFLNTFPLYPGKKFLVERQSVNKRCLETRTHPRVGHFEKIGLSAINSISFPRVKCLKKRREKQKEGKERKEGMSILAKFVTVNSILYRMEAVHL